MKVVVALLVLGIIAVLVGRQMMVRQRQEQIAQHHVAVNWPMNDVILSLGEPKTKYGNLQGGEAWTYADGTVVNFNARGTVYELSHAAPVVPGTPTPKPSTPSSPYAGGKNTDPKNHK